jgi:hypothetical protein
MSEAAATPAPAASTPAPVPAVDPAAAPVATATTPAAMAPEFQDPKVLQERLERHGRKVLSDTLGVKTPEEAIAMKNEFAAMKKEREQRELAALSDVERLTKEKEIATAEAATAKAELELERETNKLMTVLHTKGIKNVDYAKFMVDKAKAASGGKSIDYDATVSELLGDPLHRAAFGIVEPTVVPAAAGAVATPATTSPAASGTAPKPPTAGGSADGLKKAAEMGDAEWRAYKKANNLG